jgi:hypothetical protein
LEISLKIRIQNNIIDPNMEKESLLAVLIPIIAFNAVMVSPVFAIDAEDNNVSEMQYYGGGYCCSVIEEPKYNLHPMVIVSSVLEGHT